jgi:16S rRNA (cytosine967-C5)-methyltransferase
MRPGARIKAALEVLEEVLERHRLATQALADWGNSHRFAGASDRAAIGNLVYDALRQKQTFAFQMNSDTPRALALAAAPGALGMSAKAVVQCADGSAYAIEPLSESERAALERQLPGDLAAYVAGNFPEWLAPSLERVFGARLVQEGAALAHRAPLDLRTNTLKATREKVLKGFERHGAVETAFSPIGVRLPPPKGPGRQPNVEAQAGHGRGWFEVQDEGSQITALLAVAGPRQQILDICAGAGGKTLAMVAAMHNTGQIYAYDGDKVRLRPIFDRLRRAGARNVQVLPAGDEPTLAALGPRFDTVLVDAPCTGSGVWRRRPDSKWRLKPSNLTERSAEQRAVLALAAPLVKRGGRLVYATCSLLAEENRDQIVEFLHGHEQFTIIPWREIWSTSLGSSIPVSADGNSDMLLLTPSRHGTDGFFIAVLVRSA